ncbi:hypothetical protein QVD17_27592 [Tagetes erecta]|uniref:PGG domain-containing protein n=1 Tax=Tagetes erecta TaxID=13708 RepID=A0AAD8K8Y5_TARER|nr:hypothetical protein QVD17_27592 [Tagetes erecta]
MLSSNAQAGASARIQDYEYLYASNTNVSNFVSVKLSSNGNYVLWKAQMLCLLDSIGMCGVVDATFVRSSDCGMHDETIRKYDSLVKGWIFGSVSEDVLVDIYNLDCAKAVWDKLKSIYEPNMRLQEERNTTKEAEAANSLQVIVGKETTETNKNEDTEKKIKQKNYFDELLQMYNNLREAIRHGDMLNINKRLLNDPIRHDGSTMLHIGVGTHHNKMVKEWLQFVSEEQVLKKRDTDGSTALHVAAIVGNKHAAELLVKKNKKLLVIEDSNGKLPLHKAYENMHLHTIVYLLKEMESSLDGSNFLPSGGTAGDILVNAISAKQYSVALELMQKFPTVASQSENVLMAIAKTFPSGLDDWEQLIYPSLPSFLERMRMSAYVFVIQCCMLPHALYDNLFSQTERKSGPLVVGLLILVVLLATVPCVILMVFSLINLVILIVRSPFYVSYFLLWKCAKILAVGPIKQVENKAKEWDEAQEVLKFVCNEIDKLHHTGTHHPYYTRPILEAASHNAYKVVDEILARSPSTIESRDKSGYDIIQLAIINRCEKSYNVIYDIGERKNLYRTIVDSSKNNVLHLVGRLAPSHVLKQRIGAALQLQRELQWREEVRELVFPTYITEKNILEETPDMIFTKEHNELVKEGEKWMKTTAESCSITAALITTIVFAVAITVPGGSSQDKGTPLFKKEVAFFIFAVSVVISFLTSTTALVVFLSILTTRFAENDFLVSLPRKLFIGLFSLLMSTIAMMVAFTSTVFLVFCDKKLWMLVSICGLAFIPIGFFVILQFPLMVDFCMSTYLPIFGEKRATLLKGYNRIDVQSIFGKRS